MAKANFNLGFQTEKLDPTKLTDEEMEYIEYHALVATCATCHENGIYIMDEKEMETLDEYYFKGRSMGMIQDLFPKIPAWIRSGCIDQYSGGFCVCPKCSGL